MDIQWLESLLYSLVYGFTEFLPVSSQAHGAMILRLFGVQSLHPMMQLFTHIGILLALFSACQLQLKRLQRESKLLKVSARRRKRTPDHQTVCEISLLKTALVPMLLALFLYMPAQKLFDKLYWIPVFLFLNGVLIHIPMYFPGGNKDSRHMNKLDGFLLGFFAAVAMIPGMSRVGLCASAASVRGVSTHNAYKWAVLLSIPAMIAISCFDIAAIASVGFDGIDFLFVLQCLLSAVTAYIGAYFSIKLMHALTETNGLAVYSYYCWGAALFIFILYLI